MVKFARPQKQRKGGDIEDKYKANFRMGWYEDISVDNKVLKW